MTKILIAVFAASLAACSPCENEWEWQTRSGLCVDDISLEADQRAEVRAHLDEVVAVGQEWWRVESLSGWRLKFTDAPIDGSPAVTYGGSWNLILMAPPRDMVCAPGVARFLPHEMGHVALNGDPNHTDPRWSRDQEFRDRMSELNSLGCDHGDLP